MMGFFVVVVLIVSLVFIYLSLIENKQPLNIKEVRIAIIGIAIGLAVSALVAPKDILYFLPNALFYWVPQLCVLALICLLKPRPAVVGGVAIALALYLGAFYMWFFSIHHGDAMGWLGYLFSLPGALIGALFSIILLRSRPECTTLIACSVAVVFTFTGVLINQYIICSTVMYCCIK